MTRLYGKVLAFAAHRYVAGLYRVMDGRIRAGDLDLDDYVYDTRAAAATLLRIWWDDDPTGDVS